MAKTTWRGWLDDFAHNIRGPRAGSVSDRSTRRRKLHRRPQLERLEDRIAPATDVTIVVGAAGMTVGGTFSAAGVFTPTAATASVANGDIQGFLNAGTSVTINTASAFGNNGDITLANGASITKTAGANDSLTLNAVGAIIDSNATEPDITVTNLALSAGTGIAVGGALNTQVGALVARTSTGGIFINNTGDLTIGFTGNPFPGVTDTGASGGIVLTNAGTVTVNAFIENIESSNGSVTVNATGANSDVLVSRGTIAGNGAISASVTAGRDVIVDNFGLISAFNSAAANNVTVTAARNITLQATTDQGALISSGSGGITLTTGAGGIFTNNSGSGGGLFSNILSGNITIAADDMIINDPIDAGVGIVTLQQAGTTTRNIDLGLGTTAGDLDLSVTELGKVTASILRVGRTDNAGNLTVTASLINPAGASTLDLRSGGVISQTALSTIQVANLAAQGLGGVSLGEINMVSTTLAGITSNQTFTFTNGGGTLAVGLVDSVTDINAGTGNVNLTVGTAASTGILVSQFPNNGVADVTGGTVTLTALGPSNGNTGQIGFFTSSAQFFEVSATTLNAGTDNSRLWISAIGGAAVGSINAGTNTAILKTVNGDLTSTHTGSTPDITAGTVILLSPSASGSFGTAASPLEVQTSTLNASITGAGSINVRNVPAGGNFAVPLASTANGDINLSVAGGDLMTTATTGTDISAPGHTVTLNASGAVTSGTPSGITDVAAANLAVTAGTDVTLNNNDAVTTLAGSAATSFQFTNSTNLTIGSVDGVTGLTAAGGSITISTSANLAVSGPVSAGGAVALTGDAAGAGSTITLDAVINGSSATIQGGGGNDIFNINTTGTTTPLAVLGLGGNDTFNVPSSVSVPINIDGGAGTDTLNYDTLKKAIGTVPGAIRTFGLQTVRYQNVEKINLNNAAGVDAFYGPDTADRATAFAGLNADERFVQALYLDALGRAGAKSELDGWASLFNGLTQTQAQATIARGIEGSLEGRDHLVKSWYFHFLGRIPKGGEEIGWVNLLMSGQTEEQVLSDILAGNEFYQKAQILVSSGTPDERYIEALYLKLLNRTPAASEMAGWIGALPQLGRQGAALAFLQSFEFRLYQFDGYYNALLHRLPDSDGLNSWALNGLDFLGARIAFEASLEFYVRG